MTEEDQLLLAEMKAQTQQLFNAFMSLEIEKKALENELENLKSQVYNLEQSKLESERKIEQLKVANQLLSANGDNAAKQKINFLVREIDKCIALLNR